MFSNKQTKRSHETPMDFEWSGQAPTDPNSPFMKMTPQQQQQQSEQQQQQQQSQPVNTTANTATGGFGFGKSFGGASSTPAPAFRNPAFTTPRKPFNEDQFSEMSGVDSSPADNADEDTPDFQQRTRTMPASINGIGSVRQQPIFGRYGAGFAGNSPGRADRRGGKIGTAIAQKMRKRKRIDRDQDMMVKMHLQDSDSESEDSENRPRNKDNKTTKSRSKTPSPGFFASTMTYIDTHPNLPNILSYYAQLGVNMFIAFLTIFGIWSFWMTVRADVDKASEKEQALLLAEMARCAHDYVQNKCGADQRLPALGRLCESWEHCMNQDPNSIGRARVSAHTFAQIFNSFVEPISYKAMVGPPPPGPIELPLW